MRLFTSLADPKLAATLNQGGMVVLPTDTLYGVVARPTNEAAVERLYALRGRSPEKPCIMLVAGMWQIADTTLWSPAHARLAQKYWPGALSLIAPVTKKIPAYLHRGTHTLAYRVPAPLELRKLLEATGPLLAPSANLQGQPPATTLAEAEAYFGDRVDGYVDGGTLVGHASTVVTVRDEKVAIIRQGALRIFSDPTKSDRLGKNSRRPKVKIHGQDQHPAGRTGDRLRADRPRGAHNYSRDPRPDAR